MNFIEYILNYRENKNKLDELKKVKNKLVQLKTFQKSQTLFKPFVSNSTRDFQIETAIQMINVASKNLQVNPLIIRAICKHESNLYLTALRIEPRLITNKYFHNYMIKNDKNPKSPWNTASYGLMQILYWNILEELSEHDKNLPAYYLLGRPKLTLTIGIKFFKKLLKKEQTLENALSAYNAGRPTSKNYENYVKPILTLYRKYETKI